MDVPVGEVSEPIAPIEPTPAVRAELAAYLQHDSSALGDVWRRTVAGETPDQIQAARGTSRSTSVWSFNRLAAALLEGDLPTAPTVALACARKFRRILATTSLSRETVQTLTVNLHELERRSGDNLAREAEERQALRSTSEGRRVPRPASTCTRCRTTCAIRTSPTQVGPSSRLDTAAAVSCSVSRPRRGPLPCRRSPSC
jgi:hypothetical protein